MQKMCLMPAGKGRVKEQNPKCFLLASLEAHVCSQCVELHACGVSVVIKQSHTPQR